MVTEDDKAKGFEKLVKYITETPDDKLSQLTRLFRRQVLPMVWMETTEKSMRLIAKQVDNLEDWYIDKYGGKEENKAWAKQIITYRKDKTHDPSGLMEAFRKSLYNHLRSVDGANLVRLTALAETQMAGPDDDEPEYKEGQ